MKKTLKLTSIMMIALLLISSVINAYAEVIEVLDGYHQVIEIGGENDTNRANEKDGVKVSKTIAETELENYFDITLKVNTTSKIEEIVRAQDLEVILIMDISNTMVTYNIDGSRHDEQPTGTTRLQAAKTAASDFITSFYNYSSTDAAKNVIRKIGFVTFNTSSQEVFTLTDCKTESQKNDMIAKMNSIVTAEDGSSERFTNMESGLARARDMLSQSNVKNKYIIFLTDGLPTTYSTTAGGYTGYNPHVAGNNSAVTPGNFYNFEKNIKTSSSGTNYSDFGARRAEELASTIRSNNIKIFSIGVGITKQHTLYHLLYNGFANTVDTDTESNNYVYYKNRYYAVLPGVTVPSANAPNDENIKKLYDDTNYYKTWLKDYIASGNGYYFDSNNKTDLENAYSTIFEGIKQMTEQSAQATWVAEDPMEGNEIKVSNIEFIGLYDDSNSKDSLHDSINIETNGQSDTATYSESGKKIVWDLKKSSYETNVEGTTTHYIYEIKYRIRLTNEAEEFNTQKIYETNGTTTLTYVLRTNGVLSENKYIDFPIPSVVGYLGNLTFTKKSSLDNSNLSGAEFKLVHDPNCECHQQKKYATIEDVYATSNEYGTITFTNIPSGHKYKLIETIAPTDYILSDTIYNITVSYGETTGIPLTNVITNDIKKANLEIKKIVEGNNQNPGTFKFNLKVWFNGNPLTGKYNYKINDGETKVINLSEDIIELNNNDTMIIYDLPVSATYEITETTTEGYQVQYQLNSSNIEIGSTVMCNQNNTCRLEEGDNNKVKFINIAGYLLPATGSSGMLILVIIGSLLLIGPVIYIGYSFYKQSRIVS